MTRAVRRVIAWVAFAAVFCGAAWWAAQIARDEPTASAAETAASNVDPSPPKALNSAAPANAASQILEIGDYRANAAGLPPTSAPLAVQIPDLRAAAARGNATAACRLAAIGMQCGNARAFGLPDMPPASKAEMRATEENLRNQYGNLSLDGLPLQYRAYAQRRLDTSAMVELDSLNRMRNWSQRCSEAPTIAHEETLTALRQAALAGEPTSMVHYAGGVWMAYFVSGSLGMGFDRRGQGMDWVRSPAFDQWRREAPAVRREGLERGDPEMLFLELAPLAVSNSLGPLSTVERAAAVRSYATLIGGQTAESTLSLGLSPKHAEEADRLADAWVARSRERGRNVEDASTLLIDIAGVPTCD